LLVHPMFSSLRSFGLLGSKDFSNYLASNSMIMSVHDKEHSRNALCALNSVSTFSSKCLLLPALLALVEFGYYV
jgi:hypothetical protein